MKTAFIRMMVVFTLVCCISQVAFSKINPLSKGGHIIMGNFMYSNRGGELYERYDNG